MKPGDVGVIVKDDKDHKPFKVTFQGSDWYYAEKALVRATEVWNYFIHGGIEEKYKILRQKGLVRFFCSSVLK